MPMAGTRVPLALVTTLALGLSLAAPTLSGPDLCFEKVSDIAAIYMVQHPNPNAHRLVVGTQDGTIRLTTRPAVGSGQQAEEYSTFLDLTGRVRFKGEQGLLSFAFHPQFDTNGRFFASYVCDATVHADCQGPCAVSALHAPSGPASCPYNTIVAEFNAGPDPCQQPSINATEIRKVLRFGRPFENHNGGHIWFGTDGYLYYTSGDGGSQRDPLSTAQNGLMPLGKVLRVSVDGPLTKTSWGEYAIPPDNPFLNVPGVLPEIYALGLRNPWRCSHDHVSLTTVCGDVGQDRVEEVNVIKGGGNYGWSFFEGLDTMNGVPPVKPIGGAFLEPTLFYVHPAVENGQAVIGGHVYRAQRNPCLQAVQNGYLRECFVCLQGHYIYADEFGHSYVGALLYPNSTELRANATYENATQTIAPNMAFDGNDRLYSWGVDSAHELYRLSSSGIYRLTDTTQCGATCDVATTVKTSTEVKLGVRNCNLALSNVFNAVAVIMLFLMYGLVV